MAEVKMEDLTLDSNTWIPLADEVGVWQQVFDQAKDGKTQTVIIDRDLYEVCHKSTVNFPEDRK